MQKPTNINVLKRRTKEHCVNKTLSSKGSGVEKSGERTKIDGKNQEE